MSISKDSISNIVYCFMRSFILICQMHNNDINRCFSFQLTKCVEQINAINSNSSTYLAMNIFVDISLEWWTINGRLLPPHTIQALNLMDDLTFKWYF